MCGSIQVNNLKSCKTNSLVPELELLFFNGFWAMTQWAREFEYEMHVTRLEILEPKLQRGKAEMLIIPDQSNLKYAI